MADIPIERKEHRSVWPWVIGIIVLLIILWLLFGRNRGTNTAATTNRADTVLPAQPAPGTAPATTAPTAGAPGTAAPGATGTTGTSGTSRSPGTAQTTTPTGTATP